MSSQSNKKLKVVLQNLLDEHLLGRSKEDILSMVKVDTLLEGSDLDFPHFKKVLENLKEKKIVSYYSLWGEKVKAEEKYEPSEFTDLFGFPSNPNSEMEYCDLKLPKNFREKAQMYIAELTDRNEQQLPISGLILYLDNYGNLWHGDKEKNCYPMDAKSGRFFIFKYLVDNKGFQETAAISSALGGKNTQNVRTEIGKIRSNISKYLGIDGKDLIEVKDGSGYRINPKYQIVWQK